jgi:hypothetical protein
MREKRRRSRSFYKAKKKKKREINAYEWSKTIKLKNQGRHPEKNNN